VYDTDERVRRFVRAGAQPIQQELGGEVGLRSCNCTLPGVASTTFLWKRRCGRCELTNIPVAAVSTGFPGGTFTLEERIAEIRRSVGAARGN